MSEEATLDEFAQTEHSNERKETPIGELPADWDVEWLNSVVAINSDGFSEDDWPSDTFEYISLSEASNGDILGSKTTQIDEAPSRAQRTVQQGDVLVGTVRPKQKSHGLVTEEHDGKICSSGFGVLRTGPNLNSRYLIQEVLSNRFFSQMEAYVAGSGYPAVKLSDLKKHRVSIPPLSEQRKIATVLYTVDQAIEKNKEIIASTEKVQKGIITDLLNPHEYMSQSPTEWGDVPDDWKIVKIPQVCELVTDGTHLPPEQVEQGVPLMGVTDIERGKVTFTHKDIGYISEDDYKEMSGSNKPKKGDILIGAIATIGKSAIVETSKEFAIQRNLARLTPNERISPEFLYLITQTPNFKKEALSRARGSAQSALYLEELNKMELPLPPEPIQKDIVERVFSYSDYIENLEKEGIKLERLKSALMQDLLSGTVRTTDTNITVPDEVAQHG